jgi:Phasin protein
MAKRRAAPKRQAKKTMNFNRAAPRKRGPRKIDNVRHVAYNAEALDQGIAAAASDKASERAQETRRDDLWTVSTRMANQLAQNTMDNYARAFSVSMPPLASQLAAPSGMSVATTSSLIRNGVQAIVREFLKQFAQQAHYNMQAVNALARTRSPRDAFLVQGDLAKDNIDSLMQGTIRISAISLQMAIETLLRPGNQFSLMQRA